MNTKGPSSPGRRTPSTLLLLPLLPPTYGIIYLAKNKINGKVYVGQTVKSLKYRKREHELAAIRGEVFRFYQALRKYGPESFDWQVIDQADTKQKLNDKEKYWIKFYKSFEFDFGYNMARGGAGGGMLGKKHSLESRKKIGSSQMGRTAWNKGKPASEQDRLKLSLSHIGLHHSEDSKKKRSMTLQGHITSEETKRKISETKKLRALQRSVCI